MSDEKQSNSRPVPSSTVATCLAGAAIAGGVGYFLYKQLKSSSTTPGPHAKVVPLPKEDLETKENCGSCCCPTSGPSEGSDLRIPHATPLQAFASGAREKILFVTATRTPADVCSHVSELVPETSNGPSKNSSDELDIKDLSRADFIAVVDVDPASKRYGEILSELPLGNDLELHHFGWNSCAGCLGHDKCDIKQRRFLIAPAFATGDVFIIDTSDYKNIKLHRKISGRELRNKYGVSWPHTSHCLADGTVMMSFLGFDKSKSDYQDSQWLVFDGRDESFDCLGPWIEKKEDGSDTPADKDRYSYDFWYQPYHNVMISSEWGDPHAFSNGFNPADVAKGLYGHAIHFWNWDTHTLSKTINFDPNEVVMALETRFLHDPRGEHAFINGALSSNIIHCYLDADKKEWFADAKYIQVEPVPVKNWALPTMPGLITDILISMDDKFLYFANWLHGDVRQYDISDPSKPRLAGRVFVGGLLRKDNPCGCTCDEFVMKRAHTPKVKGKYVEGGPQMMQLSLDGKRLYVTNSLFSPFDEQFYPGLVKNGGMIFKIDINHERGGMTLDTEFCVDFGNGTLSGVPARPHEMRYPGGDCTSDIFIDLEGQKKA